MNIKSFTKPSYLAIGLAGAIICSFGNARANDTRIIGGFDVNIEEVPSTVALIDANILDASASLFQSQFCGGTIIGDRWVLTAAHCVESPDGVPSTAQDILVLMGTTDLRNPVADPVPVQRIIQHEEWSRRTTKNDIALLELAQRATQPAIAMDTRTPQLQDDAFIAGWGTISIDAEGNPTAYATTLQGVYVELTPGDVCGSLYPVYADSLDGTQVCVGVPEGGKGACFGDSGGPAYRVTDQNTIVLS
nr:serine protease [Gammaproteobacteria bacterium]